MKFRYKKMADTLIHILAVDSSTNHLKLALGYGGDRVVKSDEIVDQSHGQVILKKVDALFQSAGIDKSDLDAIVVSVGPGSFTGVRIGIAAAKGIAVALEIPIVAVNLFELAAFKLAAIAEPVQVIVPFKKEEFFVVPVSDGQYDLGRLRTMTIEEVGVLCGKSKFAVADEKFQEMSAAYFEHNFSDRLRIDASDLLQCAQVKLEKKQFADIINLEPMYIQKSQAEINFDLKNKN